MTENTTRKGCVATAITNLAGTKSLGIVHITNYTRMACAKTVILIATTKSVDRKEPKAKMMRLRVRSKLKQIRDFDK